jgi:uncharacterized protein (DUF58 family)
LTNELQLVPRLRKTGTGRVLEQLAEKLTHRSLIVILSDFFDDVEDIQRGMRRLRFRKHELMVFQILDPLELEFPFEDVTLFKGMEEAGELLTEPRALRDAYLEQLKIHTEALKKMCRGMNNDFIQVSSGEALDISLGVFLGRRAAAMK